MTIRYSTNFDSLSTGAMPAGFSGGMLCVQSSDTGGSVTAVSGTKFLGRNSTGYDLTRIAEGSQADWGIRFDCKAETAGDVNYNQIAPVLRMASAGDSTTGYYLRVYRSGGVLVAEINKGGWGNRVLLGSAVTTTLNPTTTDIIHVEFTCVGTSIQARLWLNATARPSSPTVSVTDSTYTTGYAMVVITYLASSWAGIDNLVFNDGTAGELGVFDAALNPVSFSGTVPTRNGVVGTAVSFANAGFFAGDYTPFTYTNVGTSLPGGLTLSSSTGIISGTPTTAATTSGIIVRATDSASNIANTNSYSIVIAATNASPTFPGNISNISGTAGVAVTPVNVSGQFSDTDALTYMASPSGTAWPSGLVVNSSTGIISGTVSGAVTTNGMKVRATDTAAQTVDSNAFNVVISAGASPTVTLPAPLCSFPGGLPLASQSGKFQFLSKTDLTLAPFANVAKTTNADGTVTPWAQAGLTAGTAVHVRWISDSDGAEANFDITPS